MAIIGHWLARAQLQVGVAELGVQRVNDIACATPGKKAKSVHLKDFLSRLATPRFPDPPTPLIRHFDIWYILAYRISGI